MTEVKSSSAGDPFTTGLDGLSMSERTTLVIGSTSYVIVNRHCSSGGSTGSQCSLNTPWLPSISGTHGPPSSLVTIGSPNDPSVVISQNAAPPPVFASGCIQ